MIGVMRDNKKLRVAPGARERPQQIAGVGSEPEILEVSRVNENSRGQAVTVVSFQE